MTMPVYVNSTAWTGRAPWAGSPIDVARRVVRSWLYPTFDCENCIGMPEHGCYCAATGATSPNEGPGMLRAWLRIELDWFLNPPTRRWDVLSDNWTGC
ncbi:hypothetical protein [Sphingobium lignivorans]|uniref:Uncharacterized protein n=1 Tax=Sphingobium lignivorans TaxID=2735886 RepID=A0ABR6NFF0_9SPHN|nr:hypothetical protein [Sphingobium lignivorans]MBB5986008.1 hypothetical protein [Sphingobium lignivorans]